MPATYSCDKYADLVFVYSFCNGNGHAAVEEYQQRYPHCMMVSHHSTFVNMYWFWRETSSCPWANRKHVQQRLDDSVLDAVQRSPVSQMCAQFHTQQVLLPLKYGEYYILVVFINTVYRESKISWPKIMHLIWTCGILWVASGKFGFASTHIIHRWSYVHPWWHK
jgi:hypothetical protein